MCHIPNKQILFFDSFSISFCWNVNEFHLLLSLRIKIEMSTFAHKMWREKKAYEWVERKVNHHHQVTAAAQAKRRNGIFMCVYWSSKNDIKEEYLTELKITWPQTKYTLTDLLCMDEYIERANNILIECLHALNCNYVASFLLRVVEKNKQNRNDD